jgi:hypothetical protein
MGPDFEFRHHPETGGSAFDCEEHILVLSGRGAHDGRIRKDNLYFDHVIECRAPHPGHGAEASDRQVAAGADLRAYSMCYRPTASLVESLGDIVK